METKPTGKQMAFLEMQDRIKTFESGQDATEFFNGVWDSLPEKDKVFWDELAEMFTFKKIENK